LIRFTCASCGKRLKAADDGAGQKISCPRCGQRLMVPQQMQNQSSVPQPATPPLWPPHASHGSQAVPQAGQVLVHCPGCGRAIILQVHELTLNIECAGCFKQFVPSEPHSPASVPRQPSADPFARVEPPRQAEIGQHGTTVGPLIFFACPDCGTPLKASPEQVGSELPCPNCGLRLQVPAPTSDSQGAKSQSPVDTLQVPQGKFCITCGANILKIVHTRPTRSPQ
jgi:DNA-directed RNA polymerase subunit RPC12/RpoP